MVAGYLRCVTDSCALGSSYPGGCCCQIRTAGVVCVLGITVIAVDVISISRSITCCGIPLITVCACKCIEVWGSLTGIIAVSCILRQLSL